MYRWEKNVVWNKSWSFWSQSEIYKQMGKPADICLAEVYVKLSRIGGAKATAILAIILKLN